MTSETIVIAIIAVSTVVSLAYLMKAMFTHRIETAISGCIMLLCPLVGPAYYFGAYIINVIMARGNKEMQMQDIGFSKEKRQKVLAPDYQTEIESVPLEELFIVAENEQKRKHLLTELKKDYTKNYSIILKALDNDDPETAHYAASAVTAAKGDFEGELRRLDSQFNKDRSNLKVARTYADSILQYLESGILDEMELQKYRFALINVLTGIENYAQFLTADDYANIVSEALHVREYRIAELWAERFLEMSESEGAFLSMLKVYYHTGQTEKFFETFAQLKSSDISLSQAGLDLVRFYMRAN